MNEENEVSSDQFYSELSWFGFIGKPSPGVDYFWLEVQNCLQIIGCEEYILNCKLFSSSRNSHIFMIRKQNGDEEIWDISEVNFSNMAFDTSFVIDEIVKGVTNKKIKNFYIYCDNFLKDISVACKFLNALRKERLRIKFMVDINLSSVDANSKQVLSLAKKSGCELVNLYVDYVMELDDVKKVQKIFKQAGLKVNLKHNRIYKNNLTDRLAFNTNFNSILKHSFHSNSKSNVFVIKFLIIIFPFSV